ACDTPGWPGKTIGSSPARWLKPHTLTKLTPTSCRSCTCCVERAAAVACRLPACTTVAVVAAAIETARTAAATRLRLISHSSLGDEHDDVSTRAGIREGSVRQP